MLLIMSSHDLPSTTRDIWSPAAVCERGQHRCRQPSTSYQHVPHCPRDTPASSARCFSPSPQPTVNNSVSDYMLATLHSSPLNSPTVILFFFCFILYSSYIIVSTVGWTWWDWSLILWTYLPSVLWHCWLGHLTCKNPSPIWPMCLVGH